MDYDQLVKDLSDGKYGDEYVEFLSNMYVDCNDVDKVLEAYRLTKKLIANRGAVEGKNEIVGWRVRDGGLE